MYWLIGAILSFFAAINVLYFLAGFGFGLNQIFYIDANEEHVNHARERAVKGFFMLLNLFMAWVVIHMVATTFGLDNANLGLGFSIIIGYVFLYAIWKLYGYVEDKTKIK